MTLSMVAGAGLLLLGRAAGMLPAAPILTVASREEHQRLQLNDMVQDCLTRIVSPELLPDGRFALPQASQSSIDVTPPGDALLLT